MMRIHDSDGHLLDATFSIERDDKGLSVVFEARAGVRGSPSARNTDYAKGLERILERLQIHNIEIVDALVDSAKTRTLPIEERRLRFRFFSLSSLTYYLSTPFYGDAHLLRKRLTDAAAQLGRPWETKAHSSARRLRLYLSFLDEEPQSEDLEQQLAAPSPSPPAYWALYADPKYYRIDEAVCTLDVDTWMTADRPMRPGDGVVIWRVEGKSGRRGIVSLGEIISAPRDMADLDNPYWLKPSSDTVPRVRVRYLRAPKLPLWLDRSSDRASTPPPSIRMAAGIVSLLDVPPARGGSVFRVLLEEWHALLNACDGWPKSVREPAHFKSPPTKPRTRFGTSYRSAVVSTSPADRERLLFFDPQKIERGIRGHVTTQERLARFLTAHGLQPLSPASHEPNYDLAWTDGTCKYVAEVKSITDDNEETQLRLGLGQVLRYRQVLAQLGYTVAAVLVPERMPRDSGWLELCSQLGVCIGWPGAFDRLLPQRMGEDRQVTLN